MYVPGGHAAVWQCRRKTSSRPLGLVPEQDPMVDTPPRAAARRDELRVIESRRDAQLSTSHDSKRGHAAARTQDETQSGPACRGQQTS